MHSIGIISTLLGFLVAADARVTFPFSEVLQKGDLYDNDAPFNCDDGCTIYVDQSYWHIEVAQNGEPIVTFAEIFGNISSADEGVQLPAGENYTLHRNFGNSDEFVFYVVSAKAPNYGSPVSILEAGSNLWAHITDRLHTIMTSENNLVLYGFTGTFAPGFPKIYAAGFDVASDTYGADSCSPVYSSRSLNPQLSTISVTSPVVTVDFGYVGDHSVSTTTTQGEMWLKTPVSSTVYTSEGFVGCPFVGDQLYEKETASVNDEFTLDSSSLDISAVSFNLQESEAVQLRVNGEKLDFSMASSPSFTKHYDANTFGVSLSWKRGTIQSSWTVQLDFGASAATSTTLTTEKATTSVPSTTTAKPTTSVTPEITTSNSHVLSILVVIIVAFLAL
ncbi:hypothetical protein PRIPAC_91579 [Pristionchus pacificus]|uniref:Uncharacterized protein n=1 Tax=Pristionchus pacificus TaxID=54126 RepID=A0A2A6BQE4_PRIPA|nr:hypothetical protein PRIPAC_91579 [Pristionchus pacificus]|eukprot:PDM68139.1 hypothetical protein PRIPAC_46183 [Pristionchus pacificus]